MKNEFAREKYSFFEKIIPFLAETGYNDFSYFETIQITTYGGNDMKGHMSTDLGQMAVYRRFVYRQWLYRWYAGVK